MSIGVTISESSGLLVVRFTEPAIRNPISSALVVYLKQVVGESRDRSDITTILFTGEEDVFASGANLREIAALDPETATAFAAMGQSLMNDIAGLPQVTIAGINGYCYGGALDLALACDRRICLPQATFAHPGTGLGIITGWGGTQRLPRVVGKGNALEMFFTAEPISAERALAIGLVDAIVDDIFDGEPDLG